ncbi:MAG: CDP-alcohol phosphatidyltransferase family protein, partial [Sedimentisphaerales bacterium]
MSRFRSKVAKKKFLRGVRHKPLRYITILPSLVTILNGVFGFAAIVFAAEGAAVNAGLHSPLHHIPFLTFGSTTYFALSGYMILVAMIADMLDGRLARSVQGTSSFGGQLDSLCDVISFGVAPAFLMLKVLESELRAAGFADENFVRRFIWVAAAAYISCAAIRLARFNVENEEDESAHMSFMGLPTPGAAGVIASLVIFHQETFRTLVIVCALPFVSLGLAILMVSRIRYPHVLNQYLRGKKPFGHLIRVVLLLVFVIWNLQAALVLIFCGFAASSFVRWLYLKTVVAGSPKKWTRKDVTSPAAFAPTGSQAGHSMLTEEHASG